MIEWIDLSYNYLTTVEKELTELPYLKTLYFHCNYISHFRDMKRLEKITKLRNCTLHGNPIAKVANYRLYILGKVMDWVMV